MSSDSKKISRRASLAAASGMLMIGSGLGAVLVAPAARAAEGTKFLLKLHKHGAKKKKTLIATIELSEELLDKLAEAGEGPLSLVVEQETAKGTKTLGQKAIDRGDKLHGAVKTARKKKKASKK
ncbi:MAG: hypothetical protein IPM35_30040 [Myxococcales bacterium]|nr:hypothetical protein [Myxococcales bacterium]